MLISLLLIIIAAAGGLSITYLVDDDAPFLWRVAAANVIGCAILGTAGFVISLGVGLNAGTVAGAALITLAPIALFYQKGYRRKLTMDWSRAKDRLQGGNAKKFLRFAYYAFFFLLFFFFFDRTMLESAAGIFTGGSQNLGDLPFHLGAIFSFTEANNFPPQNPSFAGARFSYPFVADLLTAFAVRLGAEVRDAMFVQNVLWAFSLLIVLERFVLKLTNNRLASRLAAPLLFFSGGLGFIWFFGDYWAQGRSFFDFLAHLPTDYTIGDKFRWGNSMVVLFITQRSLLLGMPLTLVVLSYLWDEFGKLATEHTETDQRLKWIVPFVVGLLAGLLPLVHLHSLAVLFVVGASLLVIAPEKWRTWAPFAAGVAATAIPELIWSMAGSANETSKFFGWHFGWDSGDKNFFWFWLINTGAFIPILLLAIYLCVVEPPHADTKKEDKKHKHAKKDNAAPETHTSKLLLFYIPFALLFVVSNIAKLAPWEWDNIKVLIYWFVGSLPLVGLVIAWMWNAARRELKVVAAVCFVVLIASGSLDVWRVVSGQINYKVFDKDAVEIARQLKTRTPANALFLNAPTYNSAVVLTGRQSLMRYPGHLSSHGINYAQRESDVNRIYHGGPDALPLLDSYGINYVIVSPEERSLAVNEQFFSRFPVAAEAGQYRAYKIK